MQTILSATDTLPKRVDARNITSQAAPKTLPDRRGDLLVFRPRRAAGGGDASDVTSRGPDDRLESTMVVIRYGGRDYLARRGMAESFLRHARAIIARGDSELVPLLHSGGVDLLSITSSTSVDVHRTSL